MDYQEASKRTDLLDYGPVRDRLTAAGRVPQILHALMGVCTESGEMMDQLKRHLIYGAKLDTTNLLEEAGDLQWYVSLLLTALGSTFDAVQAANIAKLKVRYPDKFTEDKATNRDMGSERAALDRVPYTTGSVESFVFNPWPGLTPGQR